MAADGNNLKGRKGGSQQRAPIESPDTLKSTAVVRILDLLGEGEFAGPPSDNILKDVFFDETPVMNADGTLNFQDVYVDYRSGTQDQTYMKGFPEVSNEIGVGVELRTDQPWTRAINNPQLSAVNVRLSVPQLSRTDTETADVKGHRVVYAIDLATDGGAYVQVLQNAFTGKSSDKYERGHRIDLPTATSGWLIRVRRITPEDDSQYVQDTTMVESFTEIIDVKLRYPNSAYVGVSASAEQFRSVPPRAYRMLGRIMRIPSNYNPVTREYNGAWDGTFSMGWTNNPAWIFMDLVTNERFGLKLPVENVDKWALYEIAQYCDELVPDGKGGTEPRYTATVRLTRREKAYKVLQDLGSIFQGVSFWGNGRVVPVADMPRDPVYTYTNANVKDGKFTYQGSDHKVRHTVALVAWNNPDNFSKTEVEYVPDEDAIARYGIITKEVTAFACQSQGQAQRVGRRILASDQHETNAVQFTVGLDGAVAQPGDVVYVLDAKRTRKRMGGRIKSATTTVITVDKMQEDAVPGDTFIGILPSGVAERRVIQSINGDTVTLASPFSAAPVPASIWALDTAAIRPQLFTVISVQEDGLNYNLACIAHEPDKYEFIDNETYISSDTTVAPISTVQQPVSNIVLTSEERVGTVNSLLVVVATWDVPPNAVSYDVQWRRDDGEWQPVQNVLGRTVELQGVSPGTYVVKVVARGAQPNLVSRPAVSAPFEIADPTNKPAVIVTLEEDTQSNAQAIAQEVLDRGAAITQEAQDRATAIQAAADAAALDATTKVNNAKSELQANIDAVSAQLADIYGADVWDSGTAYPEGDLVQDGGTPTAKLYRAKQPVPAGTPLSNTTYWELLGNYASLGEAVAANLVLSTTTANELDAVSQTVSVHEARMPTGTDKLANEARVISAEQAAASATQAVASDLDAVEARMPSGTGKVATEASVIAESTARADADTALGSRVDVVEARMPTGSGKLATEASVSSLASAMASGDSANADLINALDVRVGATENPNPNLLSNPTAAVDVSGWIGSTTIGRIVSPVYGTYFRVVDQLTTATRIYYAEHQVNALTGPRDFSWSIEAQASGTGNFYVDVVCRDASNAVLADGPNVPIGGNFNTRLSGTISAPAGTTKIQLRLVNNNGTITTLQWKRAKLEYGDKVTPYSEEAQVSAYGQAIDAMSLSIDQQDDFIQGVANDLDALELIISNPTTGLASKASSTDFTTLKNRVDTVGGGIETMASDIDGVQASVATKADAAAFNTLNAQVNHATTGLATKASSSALTAVEASLKASLTVLNPSFEIATGWGSLPAGVEYYTAGTLTLVNSGNRALRLAPTVPVTILNDKLNEVRVGQKIALRMSVRSFGASVGSEVHARAYFYRADGSYLTSDAGGAVYISAGAAFYTPISGNVTAPAEAAFCRFGIYCAVAPTSGQFYVDDCELVLESAENPATAAVTQLLRADVDDITNRVEATWALKLDANDKVASIVAMNDGTESEIVFDFDRVSFLSSDGGSFISGDTIEQRGNGYLYVTGAAFGANSDLMMWYGLDRDADTCTKANAIAYADTTGKFFVQDIVVGDIEFNASSSSTASPHTLQMVNNNTNGANKVITARYNFRAFKFSSKSVLPTPTGSATLSLWRKVGGGAFVQLGSTVNVTFTGMAEPDPLGGSTAELRGTAELIVTDTDTSLSDHTYEWRLTSRTNSIPPNSQSMTLKSVE